MPNVRFLACLGFFFLGCATARQAAPVPSASGPETSGRETAAARGPGPASVAALRVRMSVIPGWKRFDGPELRGASLGFRNDDAQAVITAKIIPAGDATLGTFVAEGVEGLAGLGAVCTTPTVEGESYASVRCVARGKDAARSVIAVRRPSGRPDVLLVMIGAWPAGLPEAFDEEVDLMFLLASVE